MTIVKIEPYENGAHANQTLDGDTLETFPIPEGWALVPEDLGTPDTLENYPFGEITTETVDGVPTVTGWTPLPRPEPEPEEAAPRYTELQLLGQQVTDLELMVLGGERNV